MLFFFQPSLWKNYQKIKINKTDKNKMSNDRKRNSIIDTATLEFDEKNQTKNVLPNHNMRDKKKKSNTLIFD